MKKRHLAQLEQLEGVKTGRRNRHTKEKKDRKGRGDDRRQARDGGGKECFRCGLTGHWYKNCTAEKKVQSASGRDNAVGGWRSGPPRNVTVERPQGGGSEGGGWD